MDKMKKLTLTTPPPPPTTTTSFITEGYKKSLLKKKKEMGSYLERNSVVDDHGLAKNIWAILGVG